VAGVAAAGFFCSEEAEAAPAEADPEAELPDAEALEDALPDAEAAVAESPALDFEAVGAAGFLPLESFT